MPGQTQTASLFAKLGNRASAVIQQAAQAEATPQQGFAGLPAGINNGIAQLTSLSLGGVQNGANKGKTQLVGAGVVKEPKEFKDKEGNLHKTENQYTRIAIPLYDTGDEKARTFVPAFSTDPKQRSHFQDIITKILKPLAMPHDEEFARLFLHGKTPDEIERNFKAGLKHLVKVAPHFRFHTWAGAGNELREDKGKWYLFDKKTDKPIKGKGPYRSKEEAEKANPYAGKEPMVNQVWEQSCPAPTDNGVPPQLRGIREADPSANGPTTTEETPTEEFNEFQEGESQDTESQEPDDLATLCESAANEDKAAQKKLLQLAEEAGCDMEAARAADLWDEVVTMIREAYGNEDKEESPGGEEEAAESEEVSEEPEADEEPRRPKKGEVYKYKFIGKDGKPGKPAPCEILTVNEEKQTCTIRNIASKKRLENAKGQPLAVKWDSLVTD